MSTKQARIVELVNLAAEQGITLPLTPAAIVALEERGYVVNLVTGHVTLASRLPMLAPTAKGVAKVRSEGYQWRCQRGHRRATGEGN